MNLILCGFMGCGKTTVGQALANERKMDFVDMDTVIAKEQKMEIKDIFMQFGESYFRVLEHQLCSTIAESNQLVVSTGGGVMTFARNVEMLKSTGTVIFLDVPFFVLAKRVAGSDRPLFQDQQKARALYDERISLYRSAADFIIDGADTVDAVVKKIISLLD